MSHSILLLLAIPLLVILAALAVAEFFLSRTRSVWPGLVLPAVVLLATGLVSLVSALIALYVGLGAAVLLLVLFGIGRATRARPGPATKEAELKSMAVQDLD